MTDRPTRGFAAVGPFAQAPALFTPAPLLTPAPPLEQEGEAAWFHTMAGDRLRLGFLPRKASAAGPAGTVLLSTGRSEMLEKYAETAGELAARGFDVVTHEWAGQGLSGRYLTDPMRAHVVGGARRMLANLDEVLTALTPLLPGPWIALGHSMGGGLTALALALGERRFAAAVLSAPMIGILTKPVPHPLARVVAAAAALPLGTQLARAQIDPAVRPFEGNPFTHDRSRFDRTQALLRTWPDLRLGEPTWGWVHFACTIERQLSARGAAERITCPVTIVAASDEKLVDNAAASRFADRLPRGRFTLIQGSFHEILMEQDRYRAQFWTAFDQTVAETNTK